MPAILAAPTNCAAVGSRGSSVAAGVLAAVFTLVLVSAMASAATVAPPDYSRSQAVAASTGARGIGW